MMLSVGQSKVMPPQHPIAIGAAARQRERSMLLAGSSDLVLIVAAFVVGIWANSLMIGAEALRGLLLFTLELVLLLLLRRIHRGHVHAFDYGAGKLEQFANLGIGAAMGLGGLWVAGTAAYRWWHPPDQAGLGLDFAAAVGVVNVAQNAWAFRVLSRAGRDGASVIMVGQIRTRLAKFLSSTLVLSALCVNAVFGDGPIGVTAEVLGSGFVALVMVELAVSMWRRALPSLLDRTLEETQQGLINQALVSFFDDYDEFVRVRSRISGNTPLVEIILGFAEHRQIGEIQNVVDKISDAIRTLIPASIVTVIPVAWSDGQ
jgi:divalent metal cation (Fe/Co/Zn/Cd) transporter